VHGGETVKKKRTQRNLNLLTTAVNFFNKKNNFLAIACSVSLDKAAPVTPRNHRIIIHCTVRTQDSMGPSVPFPNFNYLFGRHFQCLLCSSKQIKAHQRWYLTVVTAEKFNLPSVNVK
jgi:hypothetical protein